MAKERKAKARTSKVKAFEEDHSMLDASNKLAAALENVSNEFGVQINGNLTVVKFPKQERNRSAKGMVNSQLLVHDLNPYPWSAVPTKKQPKQVKEKAQSYVVSNAYSATR